MLFLLKQLLTHRSHHYAGLPYNLNWRIRRPGALAEFLSERPLIVYDIGARGGFPSELEGLRSVVTYYAFDADERECERLRQQGTQAFPYFVGGENRPVDFHLYRRRGESSSFRPDPRYRDKFAGPLFEVEETIELESRTLDWIVENERLDPPDLIKLDTQGSELAILAGSPRAVRDALLIETEAEFTRQYDGQPLFHDVSAHLDERGYQLLYLNRAFEQRRAYTGPARGQLVFSDALFGKREAALDELSPERLLKYVVLLTNYGHLDLADELYRSSSLELPGVEGYFRGDTALRKAAVTQFDKLICALLHLRKSNHLRVDSDRSWPTR